MAWPTLIDTSVNDSPKLAPSNYKELPKMLMSAIGSGVPLREVPIYKDAWHETYTSECGACASTNTKCIYADYYADLVGKDDNYELECLDCGKFTKYHYTD